MPPRRIRRIPASLATPGWGSTCRAARMCALATDAAGLKRPVAGLPATIWSRMITEAAKAPHRTASGTASRADLAAGQRAQVKVPG
jgi:hypothetical protein